MLGTTDTVQRTVDIQREGTSAHRQIEVFDKTHDPKAVVDWLIEETMRGV
jgi:carboxylate-amine ligase